MYEIEMEIGGIQWPEADRLHTKPAPIPARNTFGHASSIASALTVNTSALSSILDLLSRRPTPEISDGQIDYLSTHLNAAIHNLCQLADELAPALPGDPEAARAFGIPELVYEPFHEAA